MQGFGIADKFGNGFLAQATRHFDDPAVIARVSTSLGPAMVGIEMDTLAPEALLHTRGL